VLFVVGVALTVVASADPRTQGAGCARWASPTGNDTAVGSESEPFATIAHLLQTLRPGQRGCLAPGAVFDEHVVVDASGAKGAPITLMSTPNSQGAVLQGGIEFAPASHDVTIEHVAVRTTSTAQLPALVVLRGLRNELLDSDVQGAAAPPANEACVLLDHANSALISHDTIEQCGHLPDSQGYVPGILDSVSSEARIVNNVIQDSPSDAVSLAPDAQVTLVSRNVIIHNGGGVFFGGGASYASSDNTVTQNVIAFSSTYNVHASYTAGAPVGSRNVVSHNCIWQGAQGNVVGMLSGKRAFTTLGNISAPPNAKACRSDFPTKAPAPSAAPSTSVSTTRLVGPHGIDLTANVSIAGGQVKLFNLTAEGLVGAATATIVCVSGCHLTDTLHTTSAGTASSKVFANQTMPVGTVIDVTVTKSGYLGAWGRFVVQPNPAKGLVFHIRASGCLRGNTKVACPKSRG
jgi:Right handed beta helix region